MKFIYFIFIIIFNTITLKSDDLGELVNFVNEVNITLDQRIKKITTTEDTVKLFIDAGWEGQYKDPKTAIKVINYANNILNPKNYDSNNINSNILKYKGKVLSVKANLHYILWEFDSCYNYYSQSMYYRLKSDDIYEKIWAYNNITTYFNHVGQIDSSMYYLKKALMIIISKTKNQNFNYLVPNLNESDINIISSDFGYLNTYREILLNYNEAVNQITTQKVSHNLHKYIEISKLFVDLGLSTKVYGGHDLGFSYKYFNYVFLQYQEAKLVDKETIEFYNSYIKYGKNYYLNDLQKKEYFIFDKLQFYKLIPEIIENPEKIKYYKNPKDDTYLNPLDKYLHTIIQIKRDKKDKNEIKNIVFNEFDKIFVKLSLQQRMYILHVTTALFRAEIKDDLHKYYFKKYYIEHDYQEVTYKNKDVIYSTITLFENYHKEIFRKVEKVNFEKFYLLIGVILFFVIAFIAIGYLLFRNLKLVKKNKEINQQLLDRNAINKKIYEVISHDLGGPIANLHLYSKLTKDNIIAGHTEKSIKNVENIGNVSVFLNNTLETLLNYLKFDGYEFVLNKSEVDLNEIINEVETISTEMINRKNIKIIKSGIHTKLHTDPILLTIIIRNLLQNSIKFSPNNSEIIVEISEDAKNTKFNKISVIDFGTGITPDRRDKILKGVPINAGIDTENKQSTAFGFLIIRDLTHKLGGEFDIQDNSPKGTIVTITIPK